MKTNLKCLIGLFFVFLPLIGQCATVNVDKQINNFEVRNNQVILTLGDNEQKSDSSNNGTENKQSENAEIKPDEEKSDEKDSADEDDEQSADAAGTAPSEKAQPDQSKTENAESDTQKSTQNAPAPTKSTSRLKREPENAEKCAKDINADVSTIIHDQTGSIPTQLIPDLDFKDIKEQYKEYQQQRDKGDFEISAEEELKRNMVEVYCKDVGDNSNTTNGNTKSNGSEPNNAQNGDDDELVNELKAEVKQVVDAFKETKEKINNKGA